MPSSTATFLALLALVATAVNGHMMMSDPAPRQNKGNPGPNGQIDFSYTSPLGAFPCKGYPAQAPVASVAAGSSIPVTLSGGAQHDGGHCQFALSYDGDKSFVVIDTLIRECVRKENPQQLSLQIPATAPSGKATLAWTWINAVGNREYYMSCADITITGGSGPSGSLTGPELLVANLPGSQFSFPEFPGTQPDGREKFDQRKQITVRGNGGTGNGGGGPAPVPSPTAPVTTKPAATSTKTSTPPKPTATRTRIRPTTSSASSTEPIATPEPTTPGKGNDDGDLPGSTCKDGELKCKGAGIIRQCNFGKWVETTVPAGTACKEGPGGAFLGFP